MPSMTRQEADRAIRDLTLTCERIGVALYTVDGHRILGYARTATLTGRTKLMWAVLEPRLDALWLRFAALREVVDRAGQARRPNRSELEALTRLFGEPVAELGGPPATAARGLADECAAVLHDLDAFADQVDRCTRGLAALDADLATARARLAELGDSDVLLDGIAAELARQTPAVLADPLGVAWPPSWVDDLAVRLRAVGTRLAELSAFRAGFDARVAAARAALTELGVAQESAADACARATEKIRDPRLPAGGGALPDLRARLDALAAPDRWLAASRALPVLEAAIAADRTAADRRREFADGLLARRDELRGRLDAYRMKAVRLDRAEEPTVARCYQEARALLWTAPCDLPAATRAVTAYQKALNRDGG